MGWLFAQLWFLLLLSFLVGSLAATVAVHALSPSVEQLVGQLRAGRDAR